jgi:DNA polymerase I
MAHDIRPVKPGDYVYLIDGSGYIFRAYHALPPLTRRSDGLPVGAVHGFCAMLNKLLRETNASEAPTHLAVVFDKTERSFRTAMYPQYKAHRPPAPDDLIPQFALIRQAVAAFEVACVEQDVYEADDLIATYARQAVEAGAKVRIVSSDKDLMQLVVDNVVVLYDTMKDCLIGEAEVIEKFGVPPAKMIEVQALAGDSVDNVPGVPGIGVKTGAQLIQQYGDLETLLASAHEIKQPKRRENLIAFADAARMSRELVRLRDDVPLEHPLDTIGVRPPDPKALVGFLKAMEFTTLTRRIAADVGVEVADVEPSTVEIAGWPPASGEVAEASVDGPAEPRTAGAATTAGVEEASQDWLKAPIDYDAYVTVTDMEALERWIGAAREQGLVAVDTETDSLDPMGAELVGISLAVEPGLACYIPLRHRSTEGLDFSGDALAQLPPAAVLAALKPLLEDPATLKIGHNMKLDVQQFARRGIHVAPIDDTRLISYALESGLTAHNMGDLSQRHIGHRPISFKEVAGSGRSGVTFDLVPIEKAAPYAAEDADVTLRLWHVLKARLLADRKVTVYETLERPLVRVLADMESHGITVDRAVLSRLSGEFAQSAGALESEIWELAGGHFNIGSPKQLGEVLFGRLGLPGGRKTATGAWSTDSDVLDVLAAQGLPIAGKILQWRQLTKLKSTYTDALPQHINAATGRVHTCYMLAATSTGRLASTEPNLQNIPIRTEEGRKIRRAFVAREGAVLISADYSQIELRVLAHVADIPQLKRAFEDNLDIHAMTASEMFGVPIEGMDPNVRRRAKAINFGIIYGISAFGLANQLAIPRDEASLYIRTYFERFPGIRDYMDNTRRFAREHGYVETVFGRRCHFPRIAASNPSERANQERAAINAPIQGAAADVIRRAMVRMPTALANAGFKAKMLLQVHDELVFEADESEAAGVMALAIKVMEAAPDPAVALSVPLKVDARAARNWEEAH